MRKLFLLAGLLSAATCWPASAQITVLDGKYTDGNVIRVVTRVKLPAPPAMAYQVAMVKVATMAGVKGFQRFAVVKIDDCGTLLLNNNPVVQTCKIFGQMLNAGDVAIPKGKSSVSYYGIQQRSNGVFLPVPETKPLLPNASAQTPPGAPGP